MTNTMSLEQQGFRTGDRLPLPSCGFLIAALSAILWAVTLQLLS